MVEQTQKHCPQCNQYTLHARPGTNHLLHLIVTVFLCGAWIPIWILSSLKIGGWRCQSCGKGSSGIKMLIAIIFTLFLGFVILTGLKSCANSLKNQEKYALQTFNARFLHLKKSQNYFIHDCLQHYAKQIVAIMSPLL